MRGAHFVVASLLVAGCAGFETVSSSPREITYRFDPNSVSPGRVSEAATDYCENSPAGEFRAIPVAELNDHGKRVVRFNCASPPPSLDLQQLIDGAESGLKRAVQ